MEDSCTAPVRAGCYLLRGLLYCRPCATHLVPGYSSGGQRFYGCPGPVCPRPWIPAGPAEEQVWARFESRHERAARKTPADRRQEALAAVLVRISVGAEVADLEYDWRD